MNIIASIISLFKPDKLFQKKPYCIWIYEYENYSIQWKCLNPEGNSFTRCQKAIKEFTNKNFPLKRYVILPKGIKPY